jgi:hypothetical protein
MLRPFLLENRAWKFIHGNMRMAAAMISTPSTEKEHHLLLI